MSENQGDAIKKCFAGVGITDSRAYDIIFAELVRIENDERESLKQKGSKIIVKSKTDKYIAESIISMINKQRTSRYDYSTTKGIEVVVGKEDEDKENFKVIDFSKFDYESECDKLMRRYDETIVSNAKINEGFQKEILKSEKAKSASSDCEFDIVRKNLRIKELTDQIVEDQHSIFSIFRQRRIQRNQIEKDELQESVTRLKEYAQSNFESQISSEDKNRKKIAKIAERQKALLGIKYVFTRKRSKLQKQIDENGNDIYIVDTIDENDNSKAREYEEK